MQVYMPYYKVLKATQSFVAFEENHGCVNNGMDHRNYSLKYSL